MKKLILFLSLLMLMCFSAGNMWADPTVATTTFANKASNKTWAQVKSSLPCETGGLTWASSGDINGWDSNSRGIQYSAVSSDVTTTISNATITKVEVVASSNTANNSMSVTVGSTSFKSGNETSVTITKTNNTTYTWTGNASGEITVSFIAGNSGKSMYLKSIAVTYTTSSGSGGGSTNPTV